MRLVTYLHGGTESFGAVVGDGVVDLRQRLGDGYQSLRDVLRAGATDALRKAAEGVSADLALADVTLERPVPYPEKIICIGVNYANRNEEYGDNAPAAKYPSLFYRAPDSLVAHGAPILRPPESEQLDYEGEIVMIIGKEGRRVPEAQALDHIFALTCGNEGTIRDWLRHSRFNVTQGKNFDRTGAVGPWAVTMDEFSTLEGIHIATRVNGETRQDDTTDSMIFGFRYLISYLSIFTTLKPGDVIFSGTPIGAGARFDPPKWLKPGDTVEVEVAGIGTLRNTVQDEVAR